MSGNTLPRRKGKCFLLNIPFYRTRWFLVLIIEILLAPRITFLKLTRGCGQAGIKLADARRGRFWVQLHAVIPVFLTGSFLRLVRFLAIL